MCCTSWCGIGCGYCIGLVVMVSPLACISLDRLNNLSICTICSYVDAMCFVHSFSIECDECVLLGIGSIQDGVVVMRRIPRACLGILTYLEYSNWDFSIL